MKSSPMEGKTLQEYLQFQQLEFTRLTNIFNDISVTGSQRISRLLTIKEEHPDEVMKERRRLLKTRYDELVKSCSQERDRCSKLLANWKELHSDLEACNVSLKSLETKLEKVATEGADQEIGSLNEALQIAPRRSLQNQRLLEVCQILCNQKCCVSC